ncbi:MAG: hypothetical protein ABJ383_05900, partial [Balneola sp.]
NFSPFDYEEIRSLRIKLIKEAFNESNRGFLLVGTAYVEEQLTKLIDDFLPNQSKSYRKKLFEYPGQLSSLSSKIELAYCFRIIGEKLYNSLNILRKLRNDVAHSSDEFSLVDYEEKMNQIYNLGPNIGIMIHNQGIEHMMHAKLFKLSETFNHFELSSQERKSYLDDLMSDEKIISILDKQLPQWKLIIGILFISGLLVFYREQNSKVIEKYKIWSCME